MHIKMKTCCLFLVTVAFYVPKVVSFQISTPKFEAIYPKGFRFTLPDEGYSIVSFHGNLNKPMSGLEVGELSADMTKPKNGQWVYWDKNAVLKKGDNIYGWIFVVKDGMKYENTVSSVVDAFVDTAGMALDPSLIDTSVQTAEPTPPHINTGYPCELSVSKVSVPGFVCKGQLLFEDNFNSPIEVGKIWMPELMMPTEPGKTFAQFCNVFLRHFFLRIQTEYETYSIDETEQDFRRDNCLLTHSKGERCVEVSPINRLTNEDYPFNTYDKNFSVRDGSLVIQPSLLENEVRNISVKGSLIVAHCTGIIDTPQCSRVASGPQILPPIITAKVTTRNKFAFKYGRIEVRAKVPQGDWIYPEIQLEPSNYVYGLRDYASGILRVASIKGNTKFGTQLSGGPIIYDKEPYRSLHLASKYGDELWANSFHNYSLEWRPDRITLSVDGTIYGVISPGLGFGQEAAKYNIPAASNWQKGTIIAPFDDMFTISLGLNVGGVHEFSEEPGKPWVNTEAKAMLNFWNKKDTWLPTWQYDSNLLHVDYVKVFAL